MFDLFGWMFVVSCVVAMSCANLFWGYKYTRTRTAVLHVASGVCGIGMLGVVFCILGAVSAK
jgi:hypothetical protein